jgi:hypothetical protein
LGPPTSLLKDYREYVTEDKAAGSLSCPFPSILNTKANVKLHFRCCIHASSCNERVTFTVTIFSRNYLGENRKETLSNTSVEYRMVKYPALMSLW